MAAFNASSPSSLYLAVALGLRCPAKACTCLKPFPSLSIIASTLCRMLVGVSVFSGIRGRKVDTGYWMRLPDKDWPGSIRKTCADAKNSNCLMIKEKCFMTSLIPISGMLKHGRPMPPKNALSRRTGPCNKLI